MTVLVQEDIDNITYRLPKDVRHILEEHGLFLAGGYIRATIAPDEFPKDIDILGPNKDKLLQAAKDLALKRSGRVHTTGNAYTVISRNHKVSVQFIYRWLYDDPAQLLQEFDFTIAQAVVWYKKPWDESKKGEWHSLCAESYYADLAAKRLVYTQPGREEEPGGSLLRMRKFIERGYHISVPSMSKVLARLLVAVHQDSRFVNGDEDKLDDVICGLLREVDPIHALPEDER